MFYPKCPKCGGTSASAESDNLDHGIRGAQHGLHVQSQMGHAHPILKAGMFAVSIGRQVYKRFPGGGAKRCTACNHEFS